jgi:small subunit ribosomal protein S16
MLVIRLARTGRKKYPTYRIVAAESSRATTGKFVAVLGHYNPHTKELVVKAEETIRYIGSGAQPSNSVIKLLLREKLDLPKWVNLKTKTAAKPEASTEEQPADDKKVATTAADHSEEVADKEIAPSDGHDEEPGETAATAEASGEAAEDAKDNAAEAVKKEESEKA